jgi:Cu(I)/Ag(I) efflux system membrane fusion protein/cobalt-zinc-cadmium efflux system membrane fusion protein
MSKSEATKRFGFALIVRWVIFGIIVGLVATTFFFRYGEGTKKQQQAATGEATEQWYTCGMHPNVLQKEPGNCPICGMKLTPVETEKPKDQKAGERKILYWRAPMDPNYISDKPGKSPMGMDLVPVYTDEAEVDSAHTIIIDPVTQQNMGIRTAVLKTGPLVKTIRTVGRVVYDEQLLAEVNTKFEGWIDTLHVNQTGQAVEKGQPLFEIYSPQLYSAQEEYLAAMRGLETLAQASPEAQKQSRELLEAAKVKLRYLDVAPERIRELERTRRIEKNLTIDSPNAGIVTEKMAVEGMYIRPGMAIYRIADLSKVWMYLDIYEYQLPWVRLGQTATMTLPYIPDKTFAGKVIYIYPYLEEKTRVIRVRLEFDNPNLELKPDMYATVVLQSNLDREALLIPRDAYIDSGVRKVAFIYRGEGKFLPREIQTGVEAENRMVEVVSGLNAGDVVVTSGQFLLSAESQLKAAMARMMEIDRTPEKKATGSPSAPMKHEHSH